MHITPELLKRYQAGQCSAEEQQAVELWLDDHHADPVSIDEIPLAERQEIGSRVWERLRTRDRKPFWTQYRHYLSGIAAALILVGGISWYQAASRTEQPERPVVTIRIVRTQKGETRKLALPDGTIATLSYDSEIRFPSLFTDSVRRVMLTGEAHFAVKKNPQQPFIVETPTSKTRVLGTVFNIREYPGENSAKLFVAEGKVFFSDRTARNAGIFTDRQSGSISVGKLTKQTVSGADTAVSWMHNNLHFNNLPLAQIARELERKYNIRIDIRTAALKGQRYTGTFENPSLDAVLGSLCYAVKFKYEIKENSISLYQ